MSRFALVALAVLLCQQALCQDPPSEINCQDPNFVVGGTLLGAYITPNELSKDIIFTASSSQYQYNQSVHFTVTAPRNVPLADEKHVYLAVQIDWTAANGEAQGHFSELSPDLALGSNCANNLYSVASSPFNGEAHFSWTPSDHAWESPGLRLRTVGNATFKLVWANSPAGDVPNPYTYLKTLSLYDPKKWNPGSSVVAPPAPPVKPAGCVLPTHPMWSSHSYKGSPVFVQHVAGEGKQTFAAQHCIKCRRDHRRTCLSARVECPTKPGAPVIEHLWSANSQCQGKPTRSSSLPAGAASCPSDDHHSPWKLQMDRFVPKLRRDHPTYFKDNRTALNAIEEYRRMLLLMQKHPDQPAVPSKLVDLVWHEHILDTQTYKRDTLRMFGHYVHHAPSFGGASEKLELVKQQKAMLHSYTQEFDAAPGSLWQQPTAGAGEFDGEAPSADYPQGDLPLQKSPDCCQANCVKPQCASCVGCNVIDCGYMTDVLAENATAGMIEEQLSPSKFGGYVPAESSLALKEEDQDGTYLCSVSPKAGTNLSWSISGGDIYFKETFQGRAWYGVGFGNNSGMAGADYNLVIQERNFTGIKDLFKWDKGNGYPCFDVEYECSSGNGTKGTGDIETAEVYRQGDMNTATWSRRLDTGDSKDFAIPNGTMSMIFANGVEDYFTFHGLNFGACDGINLFSGDKGSCYWAS